MTGRCGAWYRLPRGNSFRRTCGSTEAGFAQLFATARVAGTRSLRPPFAICPAGSRCAALSISADPKDGMRQRAPWSSSGTEPLLRDDVLLELLRTAIVTGPDVERLLTAVRRALTLEVARQRFADRDLIEFAVALMQQCAQNEYVWVAGSDELAAMADRPLDVTRLLAGDVEHGHQFLIACLYGPAYRILDAGIAPGSVPTYGPRRWPTPLEPLSPSASTSSLRMTRLPGSGALPTTPRARWRVSTRHRPIRGGFGSARSCARVISTPTLRNTSRLADLPS